MTDASKTAIRRRDLIVAGGGAAIAAFGALASAGDTAHAAGAGDCAACSALLDRYAAVVNAHDTTSFPELFTEGYIQHSGRSPSGLQAQIDNYKRIFENWPDLQSHIDDRILGGDKVVARTTFTATHSKTVQGFAPTGKRVSWRTIDIWRVENGKFAEHWDIVDTAALLQQLRGA